MEMNTTASAMFIDSRVGPTSPAPRKAASVGVAPSSMWREMFSSTTMASSTTSTAATIRAISDSVLSEKPSSQMMPSAPNSETGIASVGISAARQSPRKASTTNTTSITASTKVMPASRRVARITGERSITTFIWMLGGSNACNVCICAWMDSTVWMMLASGWRLTTSNTAGRSLWKPLA